MARLPEMSSQDPEINQEKTPGENGPETYSERMVIVEMREKGTDGPWVQYGAAQDKEAGKELIEQAERLGLEGGKMEFRTVKPPCQKGQSQIEKNN